MFWSKIASEREAHINLMGGVATAYLLVIVNAGLACYALVTGNTFVGVGVSGYFVALVYAVVGWAISKQYFLGASAAVLAVAAELGLRIAKGTNPIEVVVCVFLLLQFIGALRAINWYESAKNQPKPGY